MMIENLEISLDSKRKRWTFKSLERHILILSRAMFFRQASVCFVKKIFIRELLYLSYLSLKLKRRILWEYKIDECSKLLNNSTFYIMVNHKIVIILIIFNSIVSF